MSSVAVLGGGISGLSTAYYLRRLAPKGTKILLIEGKKRLGGWIESKRVGSVLFEAGPRTLRTKGSNGTILLEMIQHLELKDQLLAVPKTDPSAKNRYIFYKDQINTLPSDFLSLIFNKPPILKSVLLAGLLEPFKPSRFDRTGQVKTGGEDETIYDFITRRFNRHVATYLMGSMAHGIYAGDVKQLSIQSTFRMLYEAERNYGSVVVGLMRGDTTTMRERGVATRLKKRDLAWFDQMGGMSVIGFKAGLETLPETLEAWLRDEQVELVKGDPVLSIAPFNDKIKIQTDENQYTVDHVVSCLPSRALEKTLEIPLPHLSHNPIADVAVVNLAFDPKRVQLGYDGFGFLTPHRDTSYPVPGTLGVIFDSNALKGQDEALKLTVMLGGSDWSQAFGSVPIDTLDPQIAYQKARAVLKEYLDIQDEPLASAVHLQKECIPHYGVGHEARMRELHLALKERWGHGLSVTGSSYLGVSVPDCVKHSRLLVEELLMTGALGSKEKVVTGLDKTVEGISSSEMKDSANITKSHTQILWNS